MNEMMRILDVASGGGVGLLAGLIIGILAGIGLIVLAIVLIIKSKKKK